MTPPCYRVCVWLDGRWVPFVTRTRNLLRTLRLARKQGYRRSFVWVERRPGKGIVLPMPTALGPGQGIGLHRAD